MLKLSPPTMVPESEPIWVMPQMCSAPINSQGLSDFSGLVALVAFLVEPKGLSHWDNVPTRSAPLTSPCEGWAHTPPSCQLQRTHGSSGAQGHRGSASFSISRFRWSLEAWYLSSLEAGWRGWVILSLRNFWDILLANSLHRSGVQRISQNIFVDMGHL